MDALLVAVAWERVLASGVIGGGAALVAAGCMALFQKRPPQAVEGQPADAPRPPVEDQYTDPPRMPGLSKPVAWLIILAGLCVAAAGIFWRTSLVP
jgi:hypothetical protein